MITKVCKTAIVVLLALAANLTQAQDTVVLSRYNTRSGLMRFNEPGISMYCERFTVPAPGYIQKIRIGLNGPENAIARLRVFGHEGGAPVPLLEQDIIEPILLQKNMAGIEYVEIVPDIPIPVRNNQFFLAIDSLDSGLYWLSDHTEKLPFCQSSSDSYYNQLLKRTDGSWKWEKFSFSASVILEIEQLTPKHLMVDISATLHLTDTMRYNRSIAWADVDNNGFLDLLWDNRLYLNHEGTRFEDVSDRVGLVGASALNCFLDANNDGRWDILFIGSRDTMHQPSRLFLNTEGLVFSQIDLELPLMDSAVCYSIADINGDGYLDIFVGQASDSASFSDQMLLNQKGKSFDPTTTVITNPPVEARHKTWGAQFVDVDQDGDLDLYVAHRYPATSSLLLNDGIGNFRFADSTLKLGSASGGDWKDYDNDGDFDLLNPRIVHPYLKRFRDVDGATVYVNEYDRTNHNALFMKVHDQTSSLEFEQAVSGGTWGDVDNDGWLDGLFTTSGDCRFIELYVQNPPFRFTNTTFDRGLFWSSAGHDAIWVDINNDGWQDIATIERNQLRIYKNPGSESTAGYIDLELLSENGRPDVGAKATLFAGERKIVREVTLGRGLGMGDPTRIHFGIGGANRIDSVVVEWTSGSIEVFHGIEKNAIHRITRGQSLQVGSTHRATISAQPNPFTDKLHIYYSLPSRTRVRIEVISATGAQVRSLFDEVVGSGNHHVVWNGEDNQGNKAPAGNYIYRLIAQNETVTGRVVLVR